MWVNLNEKGLCWGDVSFKKEQTRSDLGWRRQFRKKNSHSVVATFFLLLLFFTLVSGGSSRCESQLQDFKMNDIRSGILRKWWRGEGITYSIVVLLKEIKATKKKWRRNGWVIRFSTNFAFLFFSFLSF